MTKKRIIWEHMEVKRDKPLSCGDIDYYCNGDEDTDTGGWEFVGCIATFWEGQSYLLPKYVYYFKRVKP